MRNELRVLAMVGWAALAVACAGEEPDASASAVDPDVVEFLGGPDERLTAEELERGRLDPSWRRMLGADSAGVEALRSPERLEQISMDAVNRSPTFLPLGGDVAGPSVLRVQVLLDRAFFSPGIMDGRWGKNTEKAVYWLQKREGLPATGRVDSATLARVAELAGSPTEVIVERVLSADDVAGPFVQLPAEIYDAHTLECTCYESLSEKLGEQFHVAPALLEQLNPGVDLSALSEGDRLRVPAVRDPGARAPGEVAEVVVSVAGFYLHAKDAQGRLLHHFPATLGSGYDPGDEADYRVTRIARNPVWNLQPRLLHVGDPNRPPVQIPPGPNNAVGTIWMALSKPHYGIHGTAEPQTIGYATSSGCVRLTNWDANFLGGRIRAGVPVRFVDVPPDRQAHPSHES